MWTSELAMSVFTSCRAMKKSCQKKSHQKIKVMPECLSRAIKLKSWKKVEVVKKMLKAWTKVEVVKKFEVVKKSWRREKKLLRNMRWH